MQQDNFEPLNIWRPPNSIRPKVIGIAQHQNNLLVCEVLDDQGNLKGWCPLGGGIEFGETAAEALKREIFEELECSIHISGDPITYENIFEHHGFKGHEIILAFSIDFNNPEIYEKKRFQIREDKGTLHWVEWVEIERFYSEKEILFPEALLSKLGTNLKKNN